jgi:ABC-2 type transport system permease protein
MSALLAQCKAELIRSLRNRRFIIFTILFPLGFYLYFVNTIGGNTNVGGASWNAYYMMSMAAYGVLGGAVNTVGVRLAQERTKGWVRLLQTTPLKPGYYMISKIVAQLFTSTFIVLAIFLAGGLIEGVNMSAIDWIISGVWIWLGSLPFLALGILIGSVSGAQAAQPIATGVYMLLSILGGLWFPVESFSKTMQDIAHWVPTYRYAHVVWNIVAGKTPDWIDVIVLIAYLALFMLISIMIGKRQEAVNA